MNFYFCEACGKRITQLEIDRGEGCDKKLKGMFCQPCANGISTLDELPIREAEAMRLLRKEARTLPVYHAEELFGDGQREVPEIIDLPNAKRISSKRIQQMERSSWTSFVFSVGLGMAIFLGAAWAWRSLGGSRTPSQQASRKDSMIVVERPRDLIRPTVDSTPSKTPSKTASDARKNSKIVPIPTPAKSSCFPEDPRTKKSQVSIEELEPLRAPRETPLQKAEYRAEEVEGKTEPSRIVEQGIDPKAPLAAQPINQSVFFDFNDSRSFLEFQRQFISSCQGFVRVDDRIYLSQMKSRGQTLQIRFQENEADQSDPRPCKPMLEWKAPQQTWSGNWSLSCKVRILRTTMLCGPLQVRLALQGNKPGYETYAYFEEDADRKTIGAGFCSQTPYSSGNQKIGAWNGFRPGEAYALRWERKDGRLLLSVDGRDMLSSHLSDDLAKQIAGIPVCIQIMGQTQPGLILEIDDFHFGPLTAGLKESPLRDSLPCASRPSNSYALQ